MSPPRPAAVKAGAILGVRSLPCLRPPEARWSTPRSNGAAPATGRESEVNVGHLGQRAAGGGLLLPPPAARVGSSAGYRRLRSCFASRFLI